MYEVIKRMIIRVFVPIRGFCFLYSMIDCSKTENFLKEFSSPLGAFVFYMLVFDMDGTIANLFSSPLGDFVFYMILTEIHQFQESEFSSPLGDFVFYI